MSFRKTLGQLTIGIFAIILVDVRLANADEPIATFAVISNPYVTTLPAEQIKDERGSVRDFLAKTAPAAMEKTATLVNQVDLDAIVVLGSLTWAGSDADFEAVHEHLEKIKVPILTVPGRRDRLSGSLAGYRQRFSETDVSRSSKTIRGVQLIFADDLHGDPDGASERLKEQLASSRDSRAVLLFAGKEGEFSRSKLTTEHKEFWSLIEQQKVAVRFEPSRYSHRVGYEETLPIWTVGSTGWSTRGTIAVVRVFADRIEMAQVADPTQPAFTLSVPNPVNAPRMKRIAEDPYACPSYSADLALKPEFTFAFVSDPQFDRERGRDALIAKAESAIKELNHLNPAMVFITGDLVNNNLPEEWEIFNRVFEELKPARHVVAGNHDVLFNYDFVEESYSSAPQEKPEYAAIVQKALEAAKTEGFTGPTALFERYTGSKPRQTILHKDCAFITVDFLTQRASSNQISYLEEQLKKTSSRRHTFVLAHYPCLSAFGNNVQPQLGGTEVLSLLHQHRVIGYLFGHRHRNGFRMHERTAHVLTDNMGTIHLVHVFPDHIVVGKKLVGATLYEKLTLNSPRN